MSSLLKVIGAFLAGSASTGAYCYLIQDDDFNLHNKIFAASPIATSPNKAFATPGRANEIMKYGFPSNTNLKIRQNYVVSYDPRNRVPHWVFEHITKELISKNDNGVERQENFKEDESIHKYFRSTNRDYYRSGFDRGHMGAAANHRFDQMWMDETFYLSNIAPQHPQLNRNLWNNLEKYIRSLVYHNNNVYVCTGPLYLPTQEGHSTVIKYQVIGENHVAVPTHFFKVVVTEKNNNLELRSYVFPNSPLDPNCDIKAFYAPVDMIERHAGFLLFDRIPKSHFKRINDQRNQAF